MGLNELQSHVTQSSLNAVESVDLLKLANGVRSRNKNEQLKLVVDAECCLDRLYGGYFPDWVCGGQWNKMEQFLRNFTSVVQGSNLDLVVFFNGSLEPERLDTEWKKRQEETHRFVEEIHRHVSLKKKPPPKVWWCPPAYLRSAVRLAFRSLQMKMVCTQNDHHKEVVRFCQRNNFHGLIADDPEYLIFDIQRYFSAQKLKLTFKGSLETVEVKLTKAFETLKLQKERFYIFAALLSNHILSETDLNDFYSSLGIDSSTKSTLIEKVAEFTRNLDVIEHDKVAELISKAGADKEPEKVKELSEKVLKCLRYYSDLNGPKTGNSIQKDKKAKNKGSKKNDPKVPKPLATVQSANQIDEADSSSLPSDSQKLEGDSVKVFTESDPIDPEPPLTLTNGNCEIESSDAVVKSSLEKLLYRINPEIDNVATNRHKKGLMSPYICQIFRHREVKLPALIQEAKDSKELPKARDLFRPLRQRVYAILFNLHHLQFLAKQRNEKVPTIVVKEVFYSPETKSIKTELVSAVEVGWGVPTVERLWLGEKEDCKRKRIRAFLTILKSDKPVILDSTCVPQQMLVLTCVLRYILSTEKKVLRKNELEAFIAQAFIQDLTDPSIAQDIEVANLTMRGVHLSHLFMEGVEMALLANDACGAPIPYMLFCPWLFFNGKVFNYVLEQQLHGKSLAEICGYKMDLVFNIDQLRQAVTEGVKVQYASAPNPSPFLFANNAPLMNQMIQPPARVPYIPSQMGAHGPGSLTQLAAAAAMGRNRVFGPGFSLHSNNPFSLTGTASPIGNAHLGGLYGNYPAAAAAFGVAGHPGHQGRVPIYHDIPGRQRKVQQRGGQLEVAGMVVGSWGANYGPNANFANPLSVGGRNYRIPIGPAGAYVNHNMQVASLFDQMRISGGKVPNARPGSQSQSWNQKKNNKPTVFQKKSNAKSQNASSNSGKPGSSNSKSKGVSFKEDSDKSQRVDIGAGDASSLFTASGENGSSSAGHHENKSSLSGGLPNDSRVNVEG